jgi:DNA polymerase
MVIKQSEVNTLLFNKLSDEDIKASSEFAKKSALRNQLIFDIATKRDCEHCAECSNNLFVIPEGNVSADVMLVMDPPSEYDGKTHTSMFDANGRLMTVILDKLGLKRDNIYITHISKCCKTVEGLDAQYLCGAKFLLREIDLVKPKMIITLGDIAMRVVRAFLLNHDEEIDVNTVRGKVFPAEIGGLKLSIVHAISPGFVLRKQGAMYNKYKLDLWNDVNGAYTFLKNNLNVSGLTPVGG